MLSDSWEITSVTKHKVSYYFNAIAYVSISGPRRKSNKEEIFAVAAVLIRATVSQTFSF